LVNKLKIIFLFFLFPAILFAQLEDIQFEHLKVEHGLSINTIECILQDSQGFIWLGTHDGLNRYDGYKFTIFRNDPSDPTSLSANRIFSIYEDRSGVLWIGTDTGGLNKFDREKEQFTYYTNDPSDPTSLNDVVVLSIYEDSSGDLWIGTDTGGLNKLVPGDNEESPPTFIHYKLDPDDPTRLSDNEVFSICEDNFGALWIGTYGGGLNKLIPGDNEESPPTFIHFKHDPNDPSSLSSNKVRSIYEDSSGDIWIATWGGLIKLVLGDDENSPPTFIHYKHDPKEPTSLSHDWVSFIYEDNSGDIWIGTEGGGLNKLIPGDIEGSSPTFIHYKHDSKDPTSLSSNSVLSVYEDNSGLLWIGTIGGGVNKFDKEKRKFNHYKHNPYDPASLSFYSVLPIYEDNSGNIWIGTWGGGLNKFDKEKGKFNRYKHDPDDPTSLSDNEVFSICEDNSGVLWIGTLGGGLNKLVPGDSEESPPTFIHYKHDPNNPKSLSDNKVYSIYEDSSGDLWIGTWRGLNKLVPGDNKESPPTFIHFNNNPDDPSSLSGYWITSIYEDRSGALWIGTDDGSLNKLVPSDNEESHPTFIHYKHDPNDPTSLSINAILSIYEDKSGVIWIGTDGGGLNKFDREKIHFTHYRQINGLPNEMIYGILEDDHGNLWLSTSKGISKFNPQAETFRNYDERDGLQSNEFNAQAYLKSKSGEMFFGGINGFNVFHPDSIKDNTHIPPIIITDFQLLHKPVPVGFDESRNRSILKKSITETKEIELTYEDYVFSFEFAALDFHTPEKNQYAYIMEGFEMDWNYTDANRRFVTYTNLDPGEYTFRVKGSNNDGVWNEAGTSIIIVITPPWWATWWAYVLYGFFIVSLFTWITRFYLNRQRLKHQLELEHEHADKLGEIDQMKSRFFANISHEFRTPLTLIFGPAKDIIEETNESKTKQNAGMIKRNASKLYNLVNQLLDISKLEAGKMTLETTEQNIIPLLKGLVLSFTSLAERKKITLQLNTIEENLNVYIDKDKVEKIVNNLLSNAFKFTPEGGNIDFTVEKLIKEAEIRIADNGVGIPKERIDKIFDRFYQVDGSHTRESEGTGIGLALTKELVELHKGKIKVESKEEEGTTFTVLLPLGKEHLKPDEIVEKEIQEETRETKEETEHISEIESRKEKTDIDLLLETDKPLLLIVEDNSDVRKYIISHLEEDYRIQEAVDGKDGLEQALNHIPDLIISDVMMPKMDGFELCEKLKSDEKTSHIPIIILTAKATSKDKIEGYETGADDYIMKPFDAAELKVRIKNLIEIRRKLQEKFSAEDFRIPNEIKGIDEEFLRKMLKIIDEHICEEEFKIENLGKESAMSRGQIYKKVKALTGKSPSLFLRSVRLVKAKKMIKEGNRTISEIAYSVGFGSPAYFTKCFNEEFGYPPSELHK